MRARTASRLGMAAAIALAIAGCGSATPGTAVLNVKGKPLGLAVSPDGRTVLIETNRGIWRLPPDTATGASAPRLRAELRSTAGRIPIAGLLTVAYAGPDVMLGSSHPDRPVRGVPANLGLLLSRDDGRTWSSVDLYGKADLHLLQPTRRGLWALDVAGLRLAITGDEGLSWSYRDLPGAVTDLAVDPRDATHAVVVTEHGLLETRDQARSWRPAALGDANAVAWAADGTLYGVTRDGSIHAQTGDAGGNIVGHLNGAVTALAAGRGKTLWALDRDGRLSTSPDGGRTWKSRATLR